MHGHMFVAGYGWLTASWLAPNHSKHGWRPEEALVQEAALASSGEGRREEAPEEQNHSCSAPGRPERRGSCRCSPCRRVHRRQVHDVAVTTGCHDVVTGEKVSTDIGVLRSHTRSLHVHWHTHMRT